MPAIPVPAPQSAGLIWELQTLLRALARRIGNFATSMFGNHAVQVAIFCLASLMVVYPIIFVAVSFQKGVIVLSLPLWLMFFGGICGFAVAKAWK
jgi:hypothetical protein